MLLPIWRAWNAIELSEPWADEGGRKFIARELAIRNPALIAAARTRWGVRCAACGFNFERMYRPDRPRVHRSASSSTHLSRPSEDHGPGSEVRLRKLSPNAAPGQSDPIHSGTEDSDCSLLDGDS